MPRSFFVHLTWLNLHLFNFRCLQILVRSTKYSNFAFTLETAVELGCGPTCHRCPTQWFQIAKTRHKISSLDVISRAFPSKFTSISVSGNNHYTQNLSNYCRHNYGPSISRILLISFSAGFWLSALLCPSPPGAL